MATAASRKAVAAASKPEEGDSAPKGVSQKWGFFTNHALVMAYVCEHSDSTVREISDGVGITERATLAMLGDLDREGIIVRHREGRSNTYSLNFDRLAMFRRANAGPPTPTTFADGLIRTLLEISGHGGGAPPRPEDAAAFAGAGTRWGFFTNHLRVLLAIAENSDRTAHDISDSVGITERAVVAILKQLEEERIVQRTKEGRRNNYTIDLAELSAFPRWSAGPWPLPRPIVDVSVEGLRELAAS